VNHPTDKQTSSDGDRPRPNSDVIRPLESLPFDRDGSPDDVSEAFGGDEQHCGYGRP
jgi:hypothetical protein